MDRRVLRTRRAIERAFVDLAKKHPYDGIRIRDVLRDADVGKSTFYAHYRGKDDLLAQALSVLYVALADWFERVLAAEEPADFESLLRHMRANQRLFRRLTTGAATAAYLRSQPRFARMIEVRMARYCLARSLGERVPLTYAAAAIANSLLALLREWIVDRRATAPDAAAFACLLRELVVGQVGALLGPALDCQATRSGRSVPPPSPGSHHA